MATCPLCGTWLDGDDSGSELDDGYFTGDYDPACETCAE